MKGCLFCNKAIPGGRDLCNKCRDELAVIFQAIQEDSDVRASWGELVNMMVEKRWLVIQEEGHNRTINKTTIDENEVRPRRGPTHDPFGRELPGDPFGRPFGL